MSRMVQTGGAVLWEPDKSRPGEGASSGPGGCVTLTAGYAVALDPATVTADLPGPGSGRQGTGGP